MGKLSVEHRLAILDIVLRFVVKILLKRHVIHCSLGSQILAHRSQTVDAPALMNKSSAGRRQATLATVRLYAAKILSKRHVIQNSLD